MDSQAPYFVLPPYKVGLSPWSVSTITSTTSGNYGATAGAFDESGNILFYIQNEYIYTSAGVQSGLPTLVGQNYTGSTMSIYLQLVPVPDEGCRKFYAIYAKIDNSVGLVTGYVTITYSNGNVTVSNPTVLHDHAGNTGPLTVSPLYTNNTRFLYTIASGNIFRYTISSSGIGSKTTIANTSTLPNASSEALEMELNKGANKLAWAQSNGLSVISLNASGNFASYAYISLPNSNSISGLEWDQTGTKVYTSSSLGISAITVSNSNKVTIANSTAYVGSAMELGHDGLIYCVNTSGTALGKINTTNNTITLSQPISIFSNGGVGGLVNGRYNLPSQIDFDSNFAGPDRSLVLSCCVGSNQTQLGMPATNTAGCTFQWSPASNLSSATSPNPIATVNSTTTYTLTRTCGCATMTDKVKVSTNIGNGCCSQGLQTENDGEMTEGEKLLVYPNPSSEDITIYHASPLATIQIYDLMGRVVFESMTKESEMSTNLSVENLSPGQYSVVVVKSNGERQNISILIRESE